MLVQLATGSQNENEMQIWTLRTSDKTNKVADLRKEMNEKLEKMLKEMKNNRTQSVPSKKYQKQNTTQAGTSKNINNGDDKLNASDIENQENRTQDSPFWPSNTGERRTPMQPSNIQNRFK